MQGIGIDLSLTALAQQNAARVKLWHHGETSPWSGADWSNAMQGEAGEAGNIVKKLRRHETGLATARDLTVPILLDNLADEIADTIIYADLLAAHYGLNMAAAVIRKFNLVSERENWPQFLYPSAWLEHPDLRDLVIHHNVTRNQVPCGGCHWCA